MNFKEKIKEIKATKDTVSFKKVKIAVLSSYTVNNIIEPLTYYLLKNDFDPQIRLGGYNQYIQELLDPKSWLYEFDPDIIFVALSSRTDFPEIEKIEDDEIFKLIEDKYSFIKQALIGSLNKKIIVTNVEIPAYILKDNVGVALRRFNDKLNELEKNNKINIIDFDRLCSIIGKDNVTDQKLFYLGKILLNQNSSEMLARELSTKICARYSKTKKCIVTDLDNTLWGGIVGEDGPDNIRIGEDIPIGNIYFDIQNVLKIYQKKGILLAIASKNNEKDVLEVFSQKKMPLNLDDFVVKKINWESKTKNILEIARYLNIGLDSIVFLDDDPVERAEIKHNLPMIETIDFPKDIAKLPNLLKSYPYFVKDSLTHEDKNRHKMYIEEQQRNILKKNLSSEDYLKELVIRISVEKNDLRSLDRITQLINKTNQFNMRTQRYSSEQVRSAMLSKDYIISSVRASDKFGDLGLIGVIILKKEKEDIYFLDTFLMSCRALSRKIENQFLVETLKFITNKNVSLFAEYIPTLKNELVKDFFDYIGFELKEVQPNGKKIYHKSLNNLNLPEVSWIRLEQNDK